MNKFSTLIAFSAVATLMTAPCAASDEVHQYEKKAHYRVFTDSTWIPETTVRAPYNAREIPVDTMAALQQGMHVFYGTHDTRSAVTEKRGVTTVTENAVKTDEGSMNWGAGSDTLYRNGVAVGNDASGMVVSPLADGRVLVRIAGDANMNIAFVARAYDVSGLPIRQFLRDGNNRPTSLAWFVKADAVFPAGAVAYQTTWWLGDDEVIIPAKTAFTGAKTFDELEQRFDGRLTFCMSYINHQEANPFGVVFDQPQPARPKAITAGTTGTFKLKPVKKTIFCESEANPKKEPAGRWIVKDVRGTKFLELAPDAEVSVADLGIQPVNSDAMSVGFAEIKTPKPLTLKKGQKPPKKVKIQYDTRIMPARLLKANQPITDFRLRFNDAAAEAVKTALAAADESRRAWDKEHKK